MRITKIPPLSLIVAFSLTAAGFVPFASTDSLQRVPSIYGRLTDEGPLPLNVAQPSDFVSFRSFELTRPPHTGESNTPEEKKDDSDESLNEPLSSIFSSVSETSAFFIDALLEKESFSQLPLNSDLMARISADIAAFEKNKEIRTSSLPGSIQAKAKRYLGIVRKYSARYKIDMNLILAIIHTESNFIPTERSHRNAFGLMQIVPSTAGAEVNRFLKREGIPAQSELLDPDRNIEYGVAYLNILRKYHLTGIKNSVSMEYCIIAAYNAGSGSILRHFGSSRESAIKAINSLTPKEVLRELTLVFRAGETRAFVKKVLASRDEYRILYADNGVANAEKKG